MFEWWPDSATERPKGNTRLGEEQRQRRKQKQKQKLTHADGGGATVTPPPRPNFCTPEAFNSSAEAISVEVILLDYLALSEVKASPSGSEEIFLVQSTSPSASAASATAAVAATTGSASGGGVEGMVHSNTEPYEGGGEGAGEGDGEGAMSLGERRSKRVRRESHQRDNAFFYRPPLVKVRKGNKARHKDTSVSRSMGHSEPCTNTNITHTLVAENTVLLCDDCDGETLLHEVGLEVVPDEDWYCAACYTRREERRGDSEDAALNMRQRHFQQEEEEVENEEEEEEDEEEEEEEEEEVINVDISSVKSAILVSDASLLVSAIYCNNNVKCYPDSSLIMVVNNCRCVYAYPFVHVQAEEASGKQVTFRRVCRHLHPHLFASSDRNTDHACHRDETIVLAIIASLEQLLYTGQVVETVGGLRTPGTHFWEKGRKVVKVEYPPSPLRPWRPVVRFYDDENNFDLKEIVGDDKHTTRSDIPTPSSASVSAVDDNVKDGNEESGLDDGGEDRVHPDQRKVYAVYKEYRDMERAVSEGLGVRASTVRGAWWSW